MDSATATTSGMARKKTKPDDRRSGRPVRVRDELAEALDRLAERNADDFTGEVNRLIREGLERAGMWPPESSKK